MISEIALKILETTHDPEPLAVDGAHVVKMLECVLLASLSSVVSTSTALCPLIMSRDHRPRIWVIPLLLVDIIAAAI